jgi:hypothetical protein
MPGRGKVRLNVDKSFCASNDTEAQGWYFVMRIGRLWCSLAAFWVHAVVLCMLNSNPAVRALPWRWSGVHSSAWLRWTVRRQSGWSRSRASTVRRSWASSKKIKEQVAAGVDLHISLISRDQDRASHILANISRSLSSSRLWPNSGPDEVLAVCQAGCNHVS